MFSVPLRFVALIYAVRGFFTKSHVSYTEPYSLDFSLYVSLHAMAA